MESGQRNARSIPDNQRALCCTVAIRSALGRLQLAYRTHLKEIPMKPSGTKTLIRIKQLVLRDRKRSGRTTQRGTPVVCSHPCDSLQDRLVSCHERNKPPAHTNSTATLLSSSVATFVWQILRLARHIPRSPQSQPPHYLPCASAPSLTKSDCCRLATNQSSCLRHPPTHCLD